MLFEAGAGFKTLAGLYAGCLLSGRHRFPRCHAGRVALTIAAALRASSRKAIVTLTELQIALVRWDYRFRQAQLLVEWGDQVAISYYSKGSLPVGLPMDHGNSGPVHSAPDTLDRRLQHASTM